MGYFPLCVRLEHQRVLLVGEGTQTAEKAEKLAPFRPCIVRLKSLTPQDLSPRPALVVIGDVSFAQAAEMAQLCREENIPVNVVDQPSLCSFFFPSLITAGDLTISVSTGGTNPAAAAHLRREIERQLPEQTEEILLWLTALREELKASLSPQQYRVTLRAITAAAFEQGRSLTREEVQQFL